MYGLYQKPWVYSRQKIMGEFYRNCGRRRDQIKMIAANLTLITAKKLLSDWCPYRRDLTSERRRARQKEGPFRCEGIVASNKAPKVLPPVGCYLLKQSAQQLSSEERPHQYGKSDHLPANTAHQAYGYYKRHGPVNGKKPSQGEPPCTCPPVTKGQIEQKDSC
jgi:hypothetical protein